VTQGETIQPGDLTAEELVRLHDELRQSDPAAHDQAKARWLELAARSPDVARGERIRDYVNRAFSAPDVPGGTGPSASWTGPVDPPGAFPPPATGGTPILLPGDLTAAELDRLHRDLADPDEAGYRAGWDAWHRFADQNPDLERGQRIRAYIEANFPEPRDDHRRAPFFPIPGTHSGDPAPTLSATDPSGRFDPGPGGPAPGSSGGTDGPVDLLDAPTGPVPAGTGPAALAGATFAPPAPARRADRPAGGSHRRGSTGRWGARSVVAAAVGVATLGFVGATAAAAAAQRVAGSGTAPGISLTGCHGTGSSLRPTGAAVQTITAPNGSASASRPLLVDPRGSVTYRGATDAAVTNHHWHVSLYGITVRSGGSTNRLGRTTATGTEKVKDYLPFRVTGLFHVAGTLRGTGGGCSGSAWVKLTGSPIGTWPWLVAIALCALGAVLLFFGRPTVRPAGSARGVQRRPLRGLAAGVLGGAGLAGLVLTSAKAPYGSSTPVVVLGGLALLGLLSGLFGPQRTPRAARRP